MRRTAEPLTILWGLLTVGFLGCGGDHSTGQNGFALLEPSLKSLTSRLQAHYGTIQGLLGSSITIATTPDWNAIQRERDEYGQQMHDSLNDLGEKVTMIGNCWMMMGDMMEDTGDGTICPCQPYMENAIDELDTHLSNMLSWMNQHDPDGLWEEMGRHMQQMGSSIQNMSSHMNQLYGPHGMMNGGRGMM